MYAVYCYRVSDCGHKFTESNGKIFLRIFSKVVSVRNIQANSGQAGSNIGANLTVS